MGIRGLATHVRIGIIGSGQSLFYSLTLLVVSVTFALSIILRRITCPVRLFACPI